MQFMADDIQFNTMGLINQNVATVAPSTHLSSLGHTNGQNTYQYNTALGSSRGPNVNNGLSPSGLGTVKAQTNKSKKGVVHVSSGNPRAPLEGQPG